MLALLSVWLGLASLAYAVAIVVWRRLFTDVGVTVTLYAAIFSLTFAGLTLWDLRRQPATDPGVAARRLQAFVGAGLALAAIAAIYLLIEFATLVPRSAA